MKKVGSFLIIVFSLLAISACQQNQPTVNPFEGMQLATLSQSANCPPKTSPTPLADGTLFTDDFSYPCSGWLISQDSNGQTAYDNGAYTVNAINKAVIMWGYAGQNFSDVLIDVDAYVTTAGKNANNSFGVDCRVQENGDGYSFEISSDGMFAIMKYVDTNSVPLVDWTESPDIPLGEQKVHITALCQGEKLQLWVNHISIAQATDATYSSGDLSLSACSFTDSLPTKVKFTNFVVKDPNHQ
ncbi:MAG: hypothetical protein AB9897_02355 [Anaerolineaceae bacterium]